MSNEKQEYVFVKVDPALNSVEVVSGKGLVDKNGFPIMRNPGAETSTRLEIDSDKKVDEIVAAARQRCENVFIFTDGEPGYKKAA